MSAAFKLTAVDDGLFDYPIPATERLDSHFFMTWHYKRWMDSDFRSLADRDVRAVAFDLFCVAQGQAPVGTLPTDERILANLVDVPLDVWRALCERTIGPLYNWQKCRCSNGKIRLYHPVALEMVTGAVNLRDDHIEKKAQDRERKRLLALPAQMARAGASKGMAADEMYVIRLDQFMLEHFPDKQRRPNIVREAMEMLSMQPPVGVPA